jgi:hypothetical protein
MQDSEEEGEKGEEGASTQVLGGAALASATLRASVREKLHNMCMKTLALS